jgi:hypothetical protein
VQTAIEDMLQERQAQGDNSEFIEQIFQTL